MGTQLLSSQISGLDLILGGGVRLLCRVPEAEASASLLVRGGPGTGKSVLGLQLALTLADSLGGDVACACIEILPVEVEAQLAGFDTPRLVRLVLAPPFPKVEAESAKARLFAAVIDAGLSQQAASGLEEAILSLLSAVHEANGKPRVLLLDCLSDGYGLGASAPRELCDGLCKLAAERGLLLVLLEETTSPAPSGWSFAVDTVLELSLVDDPVVAGSTYLRQLRVSKNRLGPCDPGQHSLQIDQEGVRIFPRPAAYLQPWAQPLLFPRFKQQPAQGNRGYKFQGEWLSVEGRVALVYGSEPTLVSQLAFQLGRNSLLDESIIEFSGRDLLVTVSGNCVFGAGPEVEVITGSPYASASRFLEGILLTAEKMAQQEVVRRVLLGDLSSLRTWLHAEDMRRALDVLSWIFRNLKIPLILFETTEEKFAEAHPSVASVGRSTSASTADLVFVVQKHKRITLYDQSAGRSFTRYLGDESPSTIQRDEGA